MIDWAVSVGDSPLHAPIKSGAHVGTLSFVMWIDNKLWIGSRLCSIVILSLANMHCQMMVCLISFFWASRAGIDSRDFVVKCVIWWETDFSSSVASLWTCLKYFASQLCIFVENSLCALSHLSVCGLLLSSCVCCAPNTRANVEQMFKIFGHHTC